MIKDKFPNHAPSPVTSPTGMYAVTPDDASDLPVKSRIIFVGRGGQVMVVPTDNAATMTPVPITVPDGTQLVVEAVRIMATGTTATDIVVFA